MRTLDSPQPVLEGPTNLALRHRLKYIEIGVMQSEISSKNPLFIGKINQNIISNCRLVNPYYSCVALTCDDTIELFGECADDAILSSS